MGGGRKWFLPAGTPGSQRNAANDYVLPNDLADGWGVTTGNLDPARDLIADFAAAGFHYVPDKTALDATPKHQDRLLGLFSFSNMNVAKDKMDKRRGASSVVDDYGFPDQPMLDEMTAKALEVLSRNNRGFTLMVEAASIDKQAHNMDTERWILDTIEFDRAIDVAKKFAERNPDTLVIITADHECAGVNIIGASLVSNADLTTRSTSGLGTAAGGLRSGVVGTYDSAGFPSYQIADDGYPVTTDVDRKMLICYAANADRYEDWLTNPLPLRDSQQPFNSVPPLSFYPSGPVSRDVAGNFLVTGQIAHPVAAHTASDIPVSAYGRGAYLFTGVMDNTDVFFKAMRAAFGVLQ
jgi:alkaline phosphatase